MADGVPVLRNQTRHLDMWSSRLQQIACEHRRIWVYDRRHSHEDLKSIQDLKRGATSCDRTVDAFAIRPVPPAASACSITSTPEQARRDARREIILYPLGTSQDQWFGTVTEFESTQQSTSSSADSSLELGLPKDLDLRNWIRRVPPKSPDPDPWDPHENFGSGSADPRDVQQRIQGISL